ncbi:hypothetical protein DFH06DRAFT_1257363 [Mycena polygramma]|nr:hypothetical protein DFH06DRAFT_1257363 [Mycena polygramma]
MPSKTLENFLTIAEALRDRCQTEPDMNAYQPLVTSAVEVCLSATPQARKDVQSLAAHVVKRTAALAENGVGVPMVPERQKLLDQFERTLDRIRRHIETIPEQGGQPQKIGLFAIKFLRESLYLKRELDGTYKALIQCPKKHASHSTSSRNECILEIATLGTRTAAAICEIPGLGLGKPAVAMIGLICETAKTVNSNRTSARALARHAQNVTDFIVARANPAMPDSLTELCGTLQQVQDFLRVLHNRPRVTSWIFAVKHKDRFAELTSALDRALQVFSTSENICATEIVRGNTHQLITLVATVYRVENDLRTMTLHSSLKQAAPPSDTEALAQRQTNSFRSIFVLSDTLAHPFFYL